MKIFTYLKASLYTSCISVTLIFFSCNSSDNTNTSDKDTIHKMATDTAGSSAILTPSNPKPEWGKDLSDPMAVVIEKLSGYNAPPIITLTAREARRQPSPADAVMDVIKEHNIAAPTRNVDTTSKSIKVEGGSIQVRIYTPRTGKSIYPVIVYYHGGGWVIADLNTYNASAEGLSNQVDAIVVSVAYRQAPENKFPVAHKDSYAAYQWVIENAASLKGDANKIALVGESAGGNLAAAVSMMARDKAVKMPLYQVLVYPIAGYDFNTPSYKEADSTKPLNSALMKWFFQQYLNNPADGKNPMISLVSANLKGLPATTIIAAQYDPLRSEGEMLALNLKDAGVTTKYKLYKHVTHEFFGMAALVPEAQEAQAMAASDLKEALSR